MIRAMIGAAKADGIIDDVERQRIRDRLQDADPEERAFVEAEMQNRSIRTIGLPTYRPIRIWQRRSTPPPCSLSSWIPRPKSNISKP
ncbi:MAG: tellurite resistance TerB family protein [Candidatus Competibacteraceae bacterium]|nr:tellurite resistance TerB family protein [Candidatus Competibacteraceae bacterium]